MIDFELSATLPSSDYGRVARHPTRILSGGALRFGEFRLAFWNKLLRRVDLEPYQCAEAEHQRHQDQWTIITARDLRDIAEHDT